MSFSSLGLSAELVRAVSDEGYAKPTPIQVQAIPAVLAGGDLLAGAQTGTGKTAGFVLPILQRLSTVPAARSGHRKPVRALILTPTRELAAQVEESVRTYGRYLRIGSTAIFGGVGMNPQIATLRRGVDIVVATPGRLLDHVGQRTVDLSQVETLVLDEADRMLDMGFIHDIRRILALLPKRRQNLLFSATFSDEITRLADTLLDAPATIQVARRNTPVEVIAQRVHPVDRGRKTALLVHLIQSHAWYQVLVFTRTKHGANKLAEQLERAGITALAIHGNKSQGARTRALAEFKAGKLQVLVATDIAARGIDIEELPHVVNYDLPNVPEDYVHRIGRTGRAGAGGEAISLVCVDERDFLRDIEKLIGRQLPRETVAGFEPDLAARPEPIPGVTGPRRPGAGRQGNPGGGRPRNGGAGRESHAGDGRESANGGGWRKAGSAASQASPRGTSQGTARRAEPARRPQGQSPGNAGRRGR
jgi:ATP-dependent RNA helicase RhlE